MSVMKRLPEIEKILKNVFILLKENDYELAQNILNSLSDEILDLDHRASYFLAKAIILSNGEISKEIEHLEEFLNLDLYNVNLLCYLGMRYLDIDEKQKAIEYVKKAILIAPDKRIVKRIAKKVGIIEKKLQKSIKSSRQKSEFRKESSQLSIQAFRELQSQNVEQAIEDFEKALKMNTNNVHAMQGLILIANKFSQQKGAKSYQESIKLLLQFIKDLEKIEHIINIMDSCYKLNDEQLNKAINEKVEYLIVHDIENCLVIAKYFVNRRKQIAKQYLQIYKQKTNIEISFDSIDCYDKIEKLIDNNIENCLKFAKYYIKNRNMRIAQYCLEKYAEKIQKKDKIYFELMLEVLQIAQDYEFTEAIYKDAKKLNIDNILLNKYSRFLASINSIAKKKNICANSIWDYLGGLRPSDIIAARVTGMRYQK